MLLRRVSIQNMRSFLERQELVLDGSIGIVIGPNGGGKTNLLDAIVILLRRYLFAAKYAVSAPTVEQPDRHEFRNNDALNNMILDRHNGISDIDQELEIELEVTQIDIYGMKKIKEDAEKLIGLAGKKYYNLNVSDARSWEVDNLHAGMRITYVLINGTLKNNSGQVGNDFLQYLQLFEIDGKLREEFNLSPLSTPMIYLPVNRSAQQFQSTVELAGFNDYETKRHSDAASSKTSSSVVNLAIGRLVQKYRMLLEEDSGKARVRFKADKNISELTSILHDLGYEWSLETINAPKNQYDIKLKKQGTSFMVSAASSGERELLTYLFVIFALNVRDAIIIVDEPELHLHSKWQKILLDLFVRLKDSTGNQFVFATHSPIFVSPESIQYVSRVFSSNQKTQIHRLNSAELPNSKHLLNIINSQNNERIFFADAVVLVEGLSDRIFFDVFFDLNGRSDNRKVIEIVSVGGKGQFDAYASVLKAFKIPYFIIADLDYIEQVGSQDVKKLFSIDANEIKSDVIDNVKSLDAASLYKAIDDAMNTGDWNQSKDIWEYIKSRRKKLSKNLSEGDQLLLSSFLESKYTDNIYILSLGALEAYLPAGYASKDINKLIQLISSRGFLTKIPELGKAELKMIVNKILTDSDG